ncbi:MAG: hypothetical protein GYA57_21445 [Myxococcales bacterium]|nr:hypothetical protein [Myxococcales bacterium]
MRITGLAVSPARLSPWDGNGVFDRAEIAFAVEIELGRGSCLLGRDRFNFYAGWSLEVAGASGAVVRRVEGREYLDLEGCTQPALVVPVAEGWAGDTADGTAPPGPYRVVVRASLEMQRRPDGRLVTVRRAPAAEAALEVSGTPAPDELLLVEAADRKAGMFDASSTDPDATPYDDVLVPAATLHRLAEIRLALMGRTVAEEFERQRAAVRADPQVETKPDVGQEAAWRSLLEATHGRLAVEWSVDGVPANLTGLDSEPRAGAPEEVAEAWLAEFGPALAPLFRLGAAGDAATAFRVTGEAATEDAGDGIPAGERLVLDGVATEGAESAVTYRRVRGAGQVVHPVHGDFVTLFLRRSGAAGDVSLARVMRLRARWHPDLPDLPAALTPAEADAIATAAVDVEGAAVDPPTAGPFLYPFGSGRARLLYEVRVRDAWWTLSRIVWVDAVTGAVYWIRDAVQQATVEQEVTPVRRPWRPAAARWKPMPHTYVYRATDDLSAPPGPNRPEPLCVTDAQGAVPPSCPVVPGMPLRVALRGLHFEQWSPAARLGGIQAEPLWRSLPFAYAPGSGPLRVAPDPAFVPMFYSAEEQANVYYLLGYIRELYRSHGLSVRWGKEDSELAFFRTNAAPDGLRALCTVDDHCRTCSRQPGTPPNICDGYNFGHAPDDKQEGCEDGMADGDTICRVRFPDAYCQREHPGDAFGVCALATCGAGMTRFRNLWGDFAPGPENDFATRDVKVIDIDPCVRRDDAANPMDDNWSIARAVFHEVAHSAHGRNERSLSGPSFLGGLLAEDRGKPDVPINIVRIEDLVRSCHPVFGATFGGNPISGIDAGGRPDCAGSPEQDDPDDSYYCDPTLPQTCSPSGPAGEGPRNCHVRDARGDTVAVGANALDWFEGLMGRQTILRGRSGAFRGYAELVRAGLTPRTRVSSTSDSLYRYLTDASPVWSDAAELFLAFDPVIRQGRPGVFLDRLDDRTSRSGRGEARLAFRRAPVTARGTLDHPWDSDWFVLHAAAGVTGRQYTIRVRPEDPRTTDTVLEIWTHGGSPPGWRRIARDDGVERDVVSLTLDPTPAEVPLYVRVATARAAAGLDGLLFPYRFDDARVGDYQLVVYPTLDDYPDPSTGSAFPVAAHHGRAEGRLRAGDVDSFAVDLPRGGATALTVKTPGVRSGGRVFVRAQGESTWREVNRSPWILRGACGPECFETVLENRTTTGSRFFVRLDGDDLPADTRLSYLVSTVGRPGTLDTCPIDADELPADATCRIAGLGPGEATYRAGTLLDAADADSYWLQAPAGSSLQVTAVSWPGGADAVRFTVHPEDANGRLCVDRTVEGPDDRSQFRSASIAEGVAVAAPDHSGGATLSFVVPAEYVAPPGAIGWYRLRITPVEGRAAFPQGYLLLVHRGPVSDVFPEVE